jgi:hypothetical protein
MHLTITTSTNGSGSAGGSRRRLRARRVASGLAALAAAAAATLSLTAAPALADECPNEALRVENNSTQLPECRAYELVTPEFKEGFATATTQFTDDGRLAYLTNGNFNNNGNGAAGLPGRNQYLATRTGSGWTSTALAPSGPDFIPSGYYNEPASAGEYAVPAAFSSDLRSTVWNMRRGGDPYTVRDLYLRNPDGVFTRIAAASDQAIGAGVNPTASGSADLSHVVYSAGTGETYEFVGAGDGPRRTVSVDNDGQSLVGPQCPVTRGGVSADGRVILLSCFVDYVAGAADNVYARVGETTIAVFGSQCTRAPSDPGGACNAHSRATIAGTDPDDTKIYFTTSQQLVNGDTDDTNDLYECDIPTGAVAPVGSVNQCPDLREVSGADGADVQQVTRVSGDGSRVYFVATGVLASNPGVSGATAVAGEQNLYVWTRDSAHPDGEMRFVAADAGPGFAQTTNDGRYLVFTSSAQLIVHGPQADTDTAGDVYRYDAETGALVRVSTETSGGGGNEPGADANIVTASHGAISEDGRSVVFTTTEALAPNDTNGTIDSYLWHDGRVSLISSGKPSDDAFFGLYSQQPFGTFLALQTFISPSGRDVFFTTTAQMIPSDVDTLLDTYDARVEGGFDQSPPPSCSGDACQGGRSVPPPASKPDSASSTGEDDAPQIAPAFSVGKLTASQLKRVASTGKVSLTVTTNAPGRLSAKANATLAQRSSTVGSANRAVVKAGTVSLTLTLSKKARAELKRKRKLTVKVLVAQDNVATARTVSLKLTQPKPKPKPKKPSRGTSGTRTSAGGRS